MRFFLFVLFLSLSSAHATNVTCLSAVDEQLVVGLQFESEKLLERGNFEAILNYNKVNSESSPMDIYYEYTVVLGRSKRSSATSQFEIIDVDAKRLPRDIEKFVDRTKFSADVASEEVSLSGKFERQKFSFDCKTL